MPFNHSFPARHECRPPSDSVTAGAQGLDGCHFPSFISCTKTKIVSQMIYARE